MKRSWYDPYGPGDPYSSNDSLARSYKRASVRARSFSRGARAGVQGSQKAMVYSSRRYNGSRFRRRFRRRKFVRRIGRSLTPYAVTRVLKSVVPFNLDVGASGALVQLTVKLNSAYDPTGSIGAGQPLGYDQYTALYQRAGVIKWYAKLELVSTDNTYPIVVGMTPMVSSTALTTYMHYKEQPSTVSCVVTPDVDKNTITARGGVKKWFLPASARMFGDDTVTHGVGADPSRILYLHIWAQDLAQANDNPAIKAIITLYQTVKFYVPEIPSRST